MKKITILSIVTASLLLIGCGQGKTENTNGEPAKTQQESIKDKAKQVAENIKDKGAKIAQKTAENAQIAAQNIVEKTNELAGKAKTGVQNVVGKVTNQENNQKPSTEETTTTTNHKPKPSQTPTVNNTKEAPEVYAKCAGCHGKDGKMKALGKSEVIAGQSKDDLIAKIKEYKAGTRNVAGMGALMKGQVASLGDADIEAIATYVSGLK